MTSELDRLQLVLPKRYTLLRELDRGGMSRVYLAREEMPDREVAIKVFDERLSAQLGRERFLREVELTSQLGHPYIVPIHSAGDAEGALYYVMPFVRGESLRDRLEREGSLPIQEALRIAEHVAGALAHAHDRGVIHRDIKPANILFHGGHAVVADFGIARAVRVAESKGTLTGAGTSLGTPDYMSPEQISEEGQIDGRTDIYALGCVLFEMLGGQPPFHSRTRQATLARHLADTVPSLRGLRDSVPKAVEDAIRRALSKAPVDRFSSVSEFAAALRAGSKVVEPTVETGKSTTGLLPRWGTSWRLAGTLLVAAALGITWNAWSTSDPQVVIAEAPDSVSVAMMPLENRTGDASLDALGMIIADEVIAYLSQMPRVRPRALFSVRSYLEANIPPNQLIDSLEADFLLGGSMEIRRGELFVRIAETDTTGTQGEPYTFDPIALDALDAQLPQIGRDVANSFVLRRGLEERFAGTGACYGPGREEFLRGEGAMGLRTADGIRRALEHFQESLRLEGTCARTQAALSSAYALSLSYRYDLGLDPYEVAAIALVAADSAVQLDPSLADGFAARGYARILLGIDIGAAEDDFDEARRLAPNDPSSASWSSRVLASRQRLSEAYDQARLARDLDPAQAGRHLGLAELAFQVGGYEEAILAARAASLIQPLPRAFAREGLSLALSGLPDECLRLDFGEYEMARAICLRRNGQEDEALALVAQAESTLESGRAAEPGFLNDVVAELLSSYYADAGSPAQAERWLREAFQISPLGVDERVLGSELFDPVRDDPAFAATVADARRVARERVLALMG